MWPPAEVDGVPGETLGKLVSRRAQAKPYRQNNARRSMVVRSEPQGIPKTDPSTGKAQMLVYVPPHPLVKHWVAICRNKDTPSAIFRNALAELGRILIYEAARWVHSALTLHLFHSYHISRSYSACMNRLLILLHRGRLFWNRTDLSGKFMDALDSLQGMAANGRGPGRDAIGRGGC